MSANLFRTGALATSLALALFSACWQAGTACANVTARAKEPVRMIVKSTAFSEGQTIPRKHTGEGENASPTLEWSGAPAGTRQFALICDDPDAPTSEPWVHWVIYGIAASITKLSEGAPKSETLSSPPGARQGKNSWPRTGYDGPMPPPGHGWHRYFFRLYALDAELALKSGATKKDLLSAMKGHILAEAQLMGKYRRE